MKNKKKSKKKFKITLPLNFFFGGGKATIPALKKSAKKIVGELHKVHFNPKNKHGWPITYSGTIEDVFYDAYGHHLESYVINELIKYKCYSLQTGDDVRGTLIYKIKKTKPKTRRKK